MRILHFNQYGTNMGGVEAYIGEVSAALAAAGHQVGLVSFADEDPRHLMPGARQVRAGDFAQTLAAVEREIAAFCPDVIYLHAVYDARIVTAIADRLPTVAYVHGPYLVCPGYAQYLRTSERACPHRASLLCLGRAQTEHCCFGKNPWRHWQRLVQVNTMVDAYQGLNVLVGSQYMLRLLERNRIAGSAVTVLAPFLMPHPVPEPTPIDHPSTIAYVGRLTPEKGLSHLIRALSTIRLPWRLLVAGDGPERAAAGALAQRLGVEDQIHFLGWLDGPDLMSVYRQAAFVVIPSLWPEPFGRVGPQAAMHGRASVAYNSGGVSDWLVADVTGRLVPSGDVHGLREAIKGLLGSPETQAAMGGAARDHAFASWGRQQHVQVLIARFAAAGARSE